MHYTLHQLKIFLKVCEQKSITKAAEELFLTQPAISMQLKKLQEQFDVPLTEIIGRQLYVTDFGEKIAEVSKRILEEAETIDATIKQYKGLLAGKITISVVSTGKYVIPYFLSDFVNNHAGVDFSIDVTNKTKVLNSLVKNETDFALVSVLPKNLPIEKIELMDNKLYLVGKEKPTEKKVSNKALQEMRFLFREEGSATRNAMENFLKTRDIKISKLEMQSNEAIKQAVCAGLGYSIMPLIGMTEELKSGKIHIISCEGLPISTSWNLIYNKSKRLSPAALALLEHINKKKEHIIEKYF